jgi:hypothetical protein
VFDAAHQLWRQATEASGWTQGYSYDLYGYGNRAVTGSGSYIPNPSLTPSAVTQFNAKNQWTGNIKTISELEKDALARRSLADRIGDRIAAHAGKIWFIIFHAVCSVILPADRPHL